ncbi:amino acid--tRNA ligase-related protein [Streptomyces graminofaciens]|uniref:amino acid--tRNA ligase-related protein n=1 Tax=Streptomyces graminofaciens TaxID=68212 RepID=UPI002573A64F|nr:amino acid--tRNA ligase-related protein [Streptomyces graminofaciens]
MRRLYGELPADTTTGDSVVLVGRVMAHRSHGGMGFVDLRDGTDDIQLLLTDGAPETQPVYTDWQTDVDLGDQVSVSGEIVTSRTGALSIRVDGWMLASKALRPLPSAPGHGRGSTRTQRPSGGDQLPSYQRMMVDRREGARARGRASVLRALREELYTAGYLEADTPLLHALPGGTARPFVTWMNAWGVPVFLRGNTELYLKRLVVGGAERVFELGRVFRNEGTGAMHHPEFTVCEGYAAHTDYRDSAELVERLVRAAASVLHEAEGPSRITSAVLGGADDRPHRPAAGTARHGMGAPGETGRAPGETGGGDPTGGLRAPDSPLAATGPMPFARVTLRQLLSEHLKAPITSVTSTETFLQHARRHGLDVADDTTASALSLLLFRKLVRPTLTQPTFVFDFPTRAARFARPRPGDPTLVEAWSLVLAGTDIGQGCTELTDPVEQRRRMTEQRREPGLEHLPLDEEFLTAVEHGLPPLGGFSLGVDRLLGALRDDGRRLSDQQCLGLERAGTATSEQTGRDAPPEQTADQETDRVEVS